MVARFLAAAFPSELLTLPARAHLELLHLATQAGLGGGAIYDALVAASAKHAAATLLTRDRRAVATYEAIGVRYELLD